MANFISVTDVYNDELNINVDHIVLYFKSGENFNGESLIVTTYKEYQVLDTNDAISDKIKIAIKV